jgi:branched-chain amino acid transport system substrate-binding protein
VRPRSLLAGIAVCAAVAACSTGNGSGSAPFVPTTAASVVVPTTAHEHDGQLRVGVLLPQTGAGAAIGAPLRAGAELAAAEINAFGGVNGRPLELVEVDEGTSINSAAAAVDSLLDDEPVDAIVGPASSRVALAVLRRIVTRGILVCSPTATATALSTFPDADLFFRTIGSDGLQARALAEAIDQQGLTSAVVVVPDDAFGRGYESELFSALSRIAIDVLEPVRYSITNPDYTDVARAALDQQPAVVVVIGDAEHGRPIVAAMSRLGDGEVPIYVNDALRSPNLFEAIDPDDPSSAAHVRGISPVAVPNDPGFEQRLRTVYPTGRIDYAGYAYDCLNMIALGAATAGTDESEEFARQLVQVTNGGAGCSSFVECRSIPETLNIDFNGVMQTVSMAANGDNLRGEYLVFRFDETGRDIDVRTVSVGG